MSLPGNFVPRLPFPDFKWKWASLQCTEGINDPVVLLGVLARMRKLEKLNRNLTYSSDEFAEELRSLSTDIEGRGVGVDLARRTGERNLIRNSGQYWKGLGLIPVDSKGVVTLTPFGRQVADAENVTMPEVLIAAHIIPYKYHGADDRTNGFCMRSDIHILYDANELRILPDGTVELSQRARLSYGAQIPPSINIPTYVDLENLRWRCANYRGF